MSEDRSKDARQALESLQSFDTGEYNASLAPDPKAEPLESLEHSPLVGINTNRSRAEELSYKPQKSNKALAIIAAVLVVLVLLLAVIVIIGLPTSSQKTLKSGPSILGSGQQKDKNQGSAAQGQVTTQSQKTSAEQTQSDKSLSVEQKETLTKAREIFVYNTQADLKIKQLLADEFDLSYDKSISERSEYLKHAESLKTEVSKQLKLLDQSKLPQKAASLSSKLDFLTQMNLERLNVLIAAYKISLNYDDARTHKDEILQPFRDAYAPGTNGSKYVKDFKEMYAETEELLKELKTEYNY